MATSPFTAGLLQGVAGYAPQFAKGLITQRRQQEKLEAMGELEKLQTMANDRDIRIIEQFRDAAPYLTDADRDKMIKDLKKRISARSLPLLNYYVEKVEGAPELGLETWTRETPRGIEPVPESWRTGLRQLQLGTQPGFEPELGLRQLPPEQRMAAWARRAARLEPTMPGITEVGRGIMPTGAEAVLGPTAAVRQRAREAGQWGGITAITEAWTGKEFPWERREQVEEAYKRGQLDEYGYKAALTFVDESQMPDWFKEVPESWYPRLGVKKENGKIKNNISSSAVEANSQMNMRTVLMTSVTLADLAGIPKMEELRVVSFGREMLSPAQLDAINKGTSTLPSYVIDYVDDPLVLKGLGDPDWWNTIQKLLTYYTPRQIAAILAMCYDRNIREGLAREVGYRK